MQKTSELYQELLSGSHWVETSLIIGNGTDPEEGYKGQDIRSIATTGGVFSEETPVVGCCVGAEIDILMHKPTTDIPPDARLVPFCRLTDGKRYSEWLQQGVFYIDTRQKKMDGTKLELIAFHGYDDMLKTEQDYPESELDWPALDVDVVQEIAEHIGVTVDERTLEIMTDGNLIQYPAEYSCRETLGFIAGMYAGSFVMSDIGKLRLITLNGIPEESRYLVTESGHVITVGGVRILV